ncbi:type II secretion system secretin GspD [Pseudaquabacterium rugosum]|uniref:Type II secretion system secretin GspD n=1 Tax=Pseudaquabacterium rugosum TaxID=2984194 RepID=A0ABU9B506_9BURK
MTSPRPPRSRRPAHRAALRSATVGACCAALLLPLLSPVAQAAGTATRKPASRAAAPVTLNFVNADIDAVSRAMGAMMDRQILVDPRVKGNITLYAEQPIPVARAYQNYQAALRGLGFSVVESGGLLKVLPEADAKLQAATVQVGPVQQRGEQVITQIFRLNHENPNNLVAVLRPLISPNNTINANPANSSLVITDYADNLARLAKIISALDQPAATDVEVIPLEHAVAADLATTVQRLAEGGGAAAAAAAVPGASGSGVTVMADARANALIIRGPNPVRLAQLRTLIRQLDRPGAGPAGTIRVVYLRNADATKLASVLRAAFGGGSGGGAGAGGSAGSASALPTAGSSGAAGGSATSAGGATGASGGTSAATSPISASAQPSTGGFIQADPATNSLVITAPEPLFRQIRQVIDQLDGRRAQVYVESMIVEMDAAKAAELGVQWQGLLGQSGDKYGVVLGTNYGTSASNILNVTAAATSGSVTASTAINGLNIGLLQRVNGVYTLGALARLLETVSGTNILSTPNLVALDNEEAKIVVGQNVPFVTGSFTSTGSSTSTVNPFQTVERKDVGLTLKIKPQIGEGGVVRMTVYQENSSVVATTSSNTNGPTTNKNSVETTVVADDGQIMVLGGQLREQYDDAVSKVPLLGDLPLVGNLFRSDARTRTKKIMLVFLRPTVLRDAAAAAALSTDRYEAIRAQQQAAQPERSRVMGINESPMLPEREDPSRRTGAPAVAPATAPVRPVTPPAGTTPATATDAAAAARTSATGTPRTGGVVTEPPVVDPSATR